MTRHFAAWIRYGSSPIGDAEVSFALEHFRVAVLQPWETGIAARLKEDRPDMTVLAYKCLSSTRSYESGPVRTSGLGFAEAEDLGEHLFAHRDASAGGGRIEWRGYPGHWQMAVWDEKYRRRWCENVVAEIAAGPFDGVMADNDVYDDYYGLLPLEDGHDLGSIRAALERLVSAAGEALAEVGRILVPNIAESRREEGRWARHARFGGGFEEVWLGTAPDEPFDVPTCLATMPELTGPGLSIMRAPAAGPGDRGAYLLALAAAWVFSGGADVAVTATSHDGYDALPFWPEADWDLGEPVTGIEGGLGCWWREFADGYAAVNLTTTHHVDLTLPEGFVGPTGNSALQLHPRQGLVLQRWAVRGRNGQGGQGPGATPCPRPRRR